MKESEVINSLKVLYFKIVGLILALVFWFLFGMPSLMNQSSDITVMMAIGITVIMVPTFLLWMWSIIKQIMSFAEDSEE